MTLEEFSNQFDVLINTHLLSSTEYPLKFDEYEKSVFLTMAEEQLVMSLYNGSLRGKPLEGTEELRRYLAQLIKTYTASTKDATYSIGLSDNSYFFKIPKDVMYITHEYVSSNKYDHCEKKNKFIEVIPVKQDDYHRIKDNPFRGPNSGRALRLDIGNYAVEIISTIPVDSYTLRYLSKPKPIILIDLPDGLSINGINTKTECELNPVLHDLILSTAVDSAVKSKASVTGK